MCNYNAPIKKLRIPVYLIPFHWLLLRGCTGLQGNDRADDTGSKQEFKTPLSTVQWAKRMMSGLEGEANVTPVTSNGSIATDDQWWPGKMPSGRACNGRCDDVGV